MTKKIDASQVESTSSKYLRSQFVFENHFSIKNYRFFKKYSKEVEKTAVFGCDVKLWDALTLHRK